MTKQFYSGNFVCTIIYDAPSMLKQVLQNLDLFALYVSPYTDR